MKQIYHKKNELFEVEFYEDKECTKAFDFTNVKNLYIELKEGDCTPISILRRKFTCQDLYIPYIPHSSRCSIYHEGSERNITLGDITPNFSKYIPEDNAVLFLSEEDEKRYRDFKRIFITEIKENNLHYYRKWNKGAHMSGADYPLKGSVFEKCKNLTIFLPYGTQAEFQKANEVGKELKGKYGVDEVNLCALHCFHHNGKIYNDNTMYLNGIKTDVFFNKIITTNSTGILEPQNTERLQVIDCKEIFEEYLKENN